MPSGHRRGAIHPLAHPARWAIAELLTTAGPMTATELAPHVGLSPSATSYHMRELERHGIVDRRDSKDGREQAWVLSAGGANPGLAESITQARGSIIDDLEAIQQLAMAGQPAGETGDACATEGAPRHASLEVTVVWASEPTIRGLAAAIRQFVATSSSPTGQATTTRGDAEPRRAYRISVMIRPVRP